MAGFEPATPSSRTRCFIVWAPFIFSHLLAVCSRMFLISSCQSGANLGRCGNVRSRSALVVRVMMPVVLDQRLDAHTEIASSFPRVGSALHQPRRCGVPQRVSLWGELG